MRLNESILKNLNEAVEGYKDIDVYVASVKTGDYIYGPVEAVIQDYADYRNSKGYWCFYNYYNCTPNVKHELSKYYNTFHSDIDDRFKYSVMNNSFDEDEEVDLSRPMLVSWNKIYYDSEAKNKFKELNKDHKFKKYKVTVSA